MMRAAQGQADPRTNPRVLGRAGLRPSAVLRAARGCCGGSATCCMRSCATVRSTAATPAL